MAEKAEFRAILRIADKDVKGEVPISHALTQAKGVSFMFANAVCSALKLDKKQQAGSFSPAEIEKIEDCMRNPSKYNIPAWLFNRRRDRESGANRHLISADLDLAHNFDIRRLKKIRTYRGSRHVRGAKGLKLKVRGQRTRSTGRRGKTVGVIRKKKK